jgi:hypothetical protein
MIILELDAFTLPLTEFPNVELLFASEASVGCSWLLEMRGCNAPLAIERGIFAFVVALNALAFRTAG